MWLFKSTVVFLTPLQLWVTTHRHTNYGQLLSSLQYIDLKVITAELHGESTL